MTITSALSKTITGERLSREEAHDILLGITRGEYPDTQIAALLTAMQMRGVGVEEILGLRDAVFETGVKVEVKADRFIDIVGTGGDCKNTFNISTCACFVVAGAGYKVVKHGNYAATSTSGASNVIEAHGVKFTSDNDQINRSLDACNIVYLHAPLFAKAMKYVASVRKALPFPTCFNLLGPLVNPARPTCQLLGTATLGQMRLYANVYREIGVDFGIVNSIDGYDEISLTGDFKVTTKSIEKIYSPSSLDMPVASAEQLRGGDTVEEAKEIFDSVLENRSTEAQRNVVLANAAFAINVLDPSKDINEALAEAREALDSGKALNALKSFVAINS